MCILVVIFSSNFSLFVFRAAAQAMEKKNSFAKTVYSMLFSWLVDRINVTIAPTAPEASLRGKYK